ncbi:hypothetical protein pb186bvf_017297 [Paramecium bursaria]
MSEINSELKIQIRNKIDKFNEIFEYNEEEEFYIVSRKWLDTFYEFCNKVQVNKADIPPINEDIAYEFRNVIKWADDNLNVQMNETLEKKKHYSFADSETWNLLKNHCKVKHELKRFGRMISGKKRINTQLLRIRFIPISYGQTKFIEGYQLIPPYWSYEELEKQVEQLLRQSLDYYLPDSDFIRLYFLDHKLTYKQINDILKTKNKDKIQKLKQGRVGQDLTHESVLIVDIREQIKNQFYLEDEQKDDQAIEWDLCDTSLKGFGVYFDPEYKVSCLLKCYETVKAIRVHIIKNNKKYLEQLILQAYQGITSPIHYDIQQIQFYEEDLITPQPHRYHNVHIGAQVHSILFDNKLTVEKLLQDSHFALDKIHIEAVSTSYAYSIKPNQLCLTIPAQYQINIRTLFLFEQDVPLENRVVVNILISTIEDEGYQQFKTFTVKQLVVNKTLNQKQLYLNLAQAIHNMNEEEFTQKQPFKIYMKTNQKFNSKCTYCKKDICNNCLVSFEDKNLTLVQNQETNIYMVYEQYVHQQVKHQSSLIPIKYKLQDQFDFSIQTRPFIILKLDQSLIFPNMIDYPIQQDKYILQAVIEEIDQGRYNTLCKVNDKWYRFGETISETQQIQDKKAYKLVYTLQ